MAAEDVNMKDVEVKDVEEEVKDEVLSLEIDDDEVTTIMLVSKNLKQHQVVRKFAKVSRLVREALDGGTIVFVWECVVKTRK